MTNQSTLQPKRTTAELKELRALTGNEDGAQRVCWTEIGEKIEFIGTLHEKRSA